jgi:hypothetical protein
VEEGFIKQVQVNGKLTSKGVVLLITIFGIKGSIDKYRYDAWNNSMYKV